MSGDTFIYAFAIFVILLTFVGGVISLGWEIIYRILNPNWVERVFHKAVWSKELTIEPRHPNCQKCNKEVARIEEARDRRTKARRS